MSPNPLLSPSPLRTGLLAVGLALSLPLATAQAQTAGVAGTAPAPQAAAAAPAAPAEDGRRNQKIEHITVEDSGARVDEMRYGGVTQSISVQPKNAMPAYEVQPTDERRARQGDGSGGSRVWNVLQF